MKDLFIEKSELMTQFRETKENHDKNPHVRLYCHQHPNGFTLQIRGSLPIYTDKNLFKKGLKKRNLIATVLISKEEILQLAEYVKQQ